MARLALLFNALEEAYDEETHCRWNPSSFVDTSLALNEDTFMKYYRLSKTLFLELVQELSPLIKQPGRRTDLCIESKVLVALSFYATGSYQRRLGRGSKTMAQQTVSKCIKEVTQALNDPAILSAHIKFPGTVGERNAIKTKFYAKYHMPGVIGCVDSTHVAMIRPRENNECYFNRKHYHSKNVQIVCDYDLNILNMDTCFGGATHKSLIFNQHELKMHLADLNARGETVCLLGDSGYAQREYLMTPIINALMGSPEELYMKTHKLARNKIERTIRLLKARWCCLLKCRVMHYKPDMVAKIVNACCVLHNLCNKAHIYNLPDLRGAEELIAQEEEPNEIVQNQSDSISLTDDALRKGLAARQQLIYRLWNSHRTKV